VPLVRGEAYTLFVVPRLSGGDVGQVEVVTFGIAPELKLQTATGGSLPVRVHD
jgi:hypothetical protein